MVNQGFGKITSTASRLTCQGGVIIPGYEASKGAIGSPVKALRQDAERSQSILARIPAGRWGKAEKFKRINVFLASEAVHYVHDTVVRVDDGGRMRR